LYNYSARLRGTFVELDPHAVRNVLQTTAVGGFVTAQEAKLPSECYQKKKNNGAIFFTGATVSVTAFPLSSSFVMEKFALRAIAQSLARELGPQGIHIAHFIIDGGMTLLKLTLFCMISHSPTK
jgi:NAD(P)-dependent dehydrogenase (short-subunit alcohol dehydrogenase family)